MKKLLRNISGASALEFALCAPAFFAMVMGIIEIGLMVWMQLALQQGVEAAARCASINHLVCTSTATTQAFASAKSIGLAPPVSTFTVSAQACGNMVQASYTPSYLPSFPIPPRRLTAQACFPA